MSDLPTRKNFHDVPLWKLEEAARRENLCDRCLHSAVCSMRSAIRAVDSGSDVFNYALVVSQCAHYDLDPNPDA